MAKPNIFSIGDIKEQVFTTTRIFFFPAPKPDSNNCVIEGFRSTPVPIKNIDGDVTWWAEPKITPFKVFALLPKWTKIDEIQYVRSEIIRPIS